MHWQIGHAAAMLVTRLFHHDLFDHDVRAALATIGVPTLVVVGELDPSTPPNVARLLAAGIPNASFVEMPGIGHLPPNEAPQEFNRLVRE